MTFQLVLSRTINFFRVITGYFLSVITKRVIHWGYPLAVSIEPTNTCNLRCPECPSGMKELTRSRGNMNRDMFVSIIDQLSPYLSYLTLYFQGEPYLNPNFFDFVHYARSKKIYVISSTNGHFLEEESILQTIGSGLNQLIISLDGADQETYASYRVGGNLNKVIDGIRLLVTEKQRLKKKTPKVILQCLVLKSNEHKLEEIKELGRKLGVDKVVFKSAQFNDFQNGNPLMPENPRFSRYSKIPSKSKKIQNSKFKIQNYNSKLKSEDPLNPQNPKSSNPQIFKFSNFLISDSPVQYILKNRQPNSCFRMWAGCVFTWDGKVAPCCFDKDARHILGDLQENNFAEIWKSGPYNAFRATILKNRKLIEICNNCTQTF